MSDTHSGVWQAVRRALGRLVSTVKVRALSPTDLGPPLRITGEGVLNSPACDAGRRETCWRPVASTALFSQPQAGGGGRGADLASVAAVVGLNSALDPQTLSVWESSVLAKEAVIHRLDCVGTDSYPIPSWSLPVAFAPGAVHPGLTRLTDPRVCTLSVEAPRMAKRPSSPGPWAGRGGNGSPVPFTNVHVRAGMAACAEAPLVRVRRLAPIGMPPGQAFAPERRQLAQAVRAELDDVILLGVYPMVPIAAVRRLALDEEGQALSLWLKPEALRAAAAGMPPRLVTLIIGRLRSTGRMIQAVG